MFEWRSLELDELKSIHTSQPKGDSRRMIGLAHSYRRNYRRNQRVKVLAVHGEIAVVTMYGFVIKKQELNLLAIATLDNFKGHGYGRMVIEIIRREAIEHGMRFFKSEADKPVAKDWYQRKGFIFTPDNPMKIYQPIDTVLKIDIPHYEVKE